MSCPWLPGRPRFTPEAKEMVGFGMGVTGFTMTDYLAQSADRIALGYFYGAGPLGYFQNALLLYNNLLSLFTQLHDVAVSSLSKLRSNVDELKRSWATALSSLSFLFFAGICRPRRHRAGFRGDTAGPEMGTYGSPAMHLCGERNRPCRRTHTGMASRRGGTVGSLDAVGIFQCRFPTYGIARRHPLRACCRRYGAYDSHILLVRAGIGLCRTAGRDWWQGCATGGGTTDGRSACHRCNRFHGATPIPGRLLPANEICSFRTDLRGCVPHRSGRRFQGNWPTPPCVLPAA